jgi:hypothetical protein
MLFAPQPEFNELSEAVPVRDLIPVYLEVISTLSPQRAGGGQAQPCVSINPEVSGGPK